MTTPYDEDYFLRGKETGKSLYQDYRWLPELTLPMVKAIANHLQLPFSHVSESVNVAGRQKTSILDFGCARGYVVKAFRMLGYNAWGIDVSEWAIRNADEWVKPYLQLADDAPPLLGNEFDWVIAKDVLEHVPDACGTIDCLMATAKVGVFAVVPLSKIMGEKYVIPSYEEDVTHIHRFPLGGWINLFARPGWTVEAAYRVPGVKDNYYKPGMEWGNGFITARRN